MPRPPVQPRHGARVIAAALVLGLVFALVPTPQFQVLDLPFGVRVSLPETRVAAADELIEMNEAAESPLGGDRVIAASEERDEFTMIGVALEDPADEPILVRVRDDDGVWSEWIELEYSVDDGPDPGSPEHSGLLTTEPVWVGSSTAFEVSLSKADTSVAEVAIVRSSPQRVMAAAVPIADASTPPSTTSTQPTTPSTTAAPVPPPFEIRPRSAWNVRSTSTRAASSLHMAVVHHTATSNNYSAAQVPGIIRSMQAYHMDVNGWSDIGYNFLVDRFGTIWHGRGGATTDAVIGAHAAGFNTGSVGVSVIGSFQGVNPPPAALEGVARVVGWRLQSARVDPQSSVSVTSGGSNTIPAGRVVQLPRVVGHRDVGATACPGSIYSRMSWIRTRATEWSNFVAVSRSPWGQVTSFTGEDGQVAVSGWTFDPDTTDPIRVILIVSGRYTYARADRPRGDWTRHYPELSNRHGFSISTPAEAGTHRVCVKALNEGPGNPWTILGCSDVVVK